MRRVPLIFLLGLALGCRKRPMPDDAPKPVPSTEVVPSGEPSHAAIESTLCGARSPCQLLEVTRAGQAMWVAKLTTDPAGAKDAPAKPDCVPYEYWLVHGKGTSIVDRRELLRVCNDGYGAAQVGEDRITIEPGRFTHVQSGGSAWRWEHGRTLELSPLRLSRITWASGATIAAVAERGAFDWLAFRGRARWYRPECPAGGGPPAEPDYDEMTIIDRPADPRAYVYDPLPVVELPASFRGGDWKTTALGSCAPPIDGVGERGFVISGPPGDANDASLRVIAAKTKDPKSIELHVEIVDDAFVGPSAKWLFDDHLEIWLEEEDPDPSELCIPGPAGGGAGALRQWAIRLADGKVFPGHHATGVPDPFTVARAEGKSVDGRSVVRLKVEIAAPSLQAVTVVYSDSDDGKMQKRLLATSRLKFGKAPTLGRLWPVEPTDAICVVENGTLERKLTRTFPANAPALQE